MTKEKPTACTTDIILKAIPTAAVLCVLIRPTKYVSATLYALVISIEMIVGIAIVNITRDTGAFVKNTYLSLSVFMNSLCLMQS